MGHISLPGNVTSASSRLQVAPLVFFPAAALIIGLVHFAVGWPELADLYFNGLRKWIISNLGWLLHGSISFVLLFALGLLCTRWGRIRLSTDDGPPEFSTSSWLAMLFSAGMGIGLMFFSVAEPMYHYASPPVGEGGSAQAARQAMGVTFFHWGLHAWGVYAVMGLALAYFCHRKSLPLSLRSVLQPLLGRRVHGPIGDLVDLIAVFGTVFGLATSLGLGAKQVNAGLTHLFGVANTTHSQVVIIVLITLAATASLLSGVQRGIRRLSELNLILAFSLLAFVLICGPTWHVLSKLPADLMAYGEHAGHAFFSSARMGSLEWQAGWTLFYWAWWIAWAPFVGCFIARISKGRSIREFLVGVLLVPTAFTVLWLTVFGETALNLERVQGVEISSVVQQDSAVALFALLEVLPLAEYSTVAAVLTVAVFFVTSSDSGSYVVDMLTSGGHPNPPRWQRIFWALTEGAVAVTLLMAGDLEALQSAAIATGLLFCMVIPLSCLSLVRALRCDRAGIIQGYQTRF
jgi:choline/glycine/proline betaine transport protein